MGLLSLKRLISTQRKRVVERRRRQIQVRNGSVASWAKRKGLPCQQDDDSQGFKRMRYSGPDLPEDIWGHIHSLMPLQDAARAACVSRSFLRSWRYHPNLTFSMETLGLIENARDFAKKVDHILQNHSGIGVKTLTIQFTGFYKADTSYYLNNWIPIAVTPGIEELTLMLSSRKAKYDFPCSILSDGSGSSIRYLRLGWCVFRPTVKLGCLRSLTRLYLYDVRISGDELGCILSNSFALEQLELMYCNEIICVKIPCLLQRLSLLRVFDCTRLRVLENNAPNLCSFHHGGNKVQLPLGELSQVKNLYMHSSSVLYYALAELPSSVPNLETLTIDTLSEVVNTPMVPSKFLHLKYLRIGLGGLYTNPAYDYFSLVSFLDASPSLETLILDVFHGLMEHESIFGDSSHLRQMPEHRHDNLRSVKITGFFSAKSLVELTCHILENTSLESLTLDTTHGVFTCSTSRCGKCYPLAKGMLMEAHRALLAIRTYIEGKVPSTVKLNVVEPCSRCHAIEL